MIRVKLANRFELNISVIFFGSEPTQVDRGEDWSVAQ